MHSQNNVDATQQSLFTTGSLARAPTVAPAKSISTNQSKMNGRVIAARPGAAGSRANMRVEMSATKKGDAISV